METGEATLYSILGGLATAVVSGIAWLCVNKCRNQECSVNSGCCAFHSDSRLRATIRDEIQRSHSTHDNSAEASPPTAPSAVAPQSV